MCRLALYLMFIVLFFSTNPSTAHEKRYFSISGGSIAGIYFHVANQLCGYLNEAAQEKRCESRSGFGSAFNINALESNLLEFALAQSDLQWNAWHGTEEWQGMPVSNIRTVATLHTEAVHLVARKSSGIKTIADLKQRNISVGNRSSGQRKNALSVLDLYEIDVEDDIHAYGLLQGKVLTWIVSGDLDAFFYTVGYPSLSIETLAKRVPLNFLDLSDEIVQKFVVGNRAYQFIEIPARTYTGQTKTVRTFGSRSSLLTSADVSDEQVYELLSVLHDKFDDLKSSHPSLNRLRLENLPRNTTVPLHDGAVKFYREKGLLN